MFRQRGDREYEESSAAGVRELFSLGPFVFEDTMDGEGGLHHFVLSTGAEDPACYEADRETMYELMARYLAGEHEKRAYSLGRSPGHESLLDLLEMATARARGGETELSFEDLERGEAELMDDEDRDPDRPGR